MLGELPGLTAGRLCHSSGCLCTCILWAAVSVSLVSRCAVLNPTISSDCYLNFHNRNGMTGITQLVTGVVSNPWASALTLMCQPC